MEQSVGTYTETLWPATEVSFLIRSSEDAVRIAETLKSYCINSMDGERLAEIEELLSLVRHWDAPLVPEAWKRISELCWRIGIDAETCCDGDKYGLIAAALRSAAERKCSAQSTPAKGDNSK